MYPARTSSWWLGTSASAGFSRRVRRNREDIRMATIRGLSVSGWATRTGYRADRDAPARAADAPELEHL